MRSLVIGYPVDWQKSIIAKSTIEPILWICNKPDCARFPGTIFQTDLEGTNGVRPEGVLNSSIKYLKDEFFIENLKLVDVCHKLIETRKDAYKGKSFSTYHRIREFIYKETAYYYSLLKELDIECVVIESMPHMHYHYIPYYLGNLLGRKVIIDYRTGEPPRYFLTNSFSNMTPDCLSNETSSDPVTKRQLAPSYFSGEKLSWQSIFDLNKIPNRIRNLPAISKYLCESSKEFIRLKMIQLRSIHKIAEHNKLCRQSVPSGKFVFFALHMQPEDTSYPIGGNFDDQIYAINYLLELLPADYTIAVKEHPNQQMHRGREYGYYQRLCSNPRVELISQSIGTFDLIKNCEFVSTITGFVGWEALTNLKPVITFAQAWYQGFKAVYYISEVKNNPAFFDEVSDFSLDEVNDFYSFVCSKTFRGVITQASFPSLGVDIDTNIDFVSNSIDHFLENYNWKEAAQNHF